MDETELYEILPYEPDDRKLIVKCTDERAVALAIGCKGRWLKRVEGYVMSRTQMRKFKFLCENGWESKYGTVFIAPAHVTPDDVDPDYTDTADTDSADTDVKCV